MTRLPEQNEIVAGQWYRDAPGVAEASVEQGIAKTLRLKLGDVMRFDMGGLLVDAKITSLRKLEWGSMRANFFVIINPARWRMRRTTYMTAFHLPRAEAALANTLTRLSEPDRDRRQRHHPPGAGGAGPGGDRGRVPVPVHAGLRRAGAVRGADGIAGRAHPRSRAAARAGRHPRKQLAQAQRIEFVLVGGLSGLLAASGAAALGWALAEYQFKFPWRSSRACGRPGWWWARCARWSAAGWAAQCVAAAAAADAARGLIKGR
jgi:putative ABC transport system permease protein